MNASARLAFRLLCSASIPLLNLQISLLSVAIPFALNASSAVAQAKGADAIAKIAQAITIRIDGATQGSGVLVKREGNRYTVLTAWHVVSGQRPGEELDVYAPDGKRHSIEQGSLVKLGEVDLAVMTFSSSSSYSTALLGNAESVSTGSIIYVSGYPLPTSAVPTRIFRFRDGLVEANAKTFLPRGYQLLYSNPTLPGMSGGAVMDSAGRLVAIHGQSETEEKVSEEQGFAIKTGTSQAVPISYFKDYAASVSIVVPAAQEVQPGSQAAYEAGVPDKSKGGDAALVGALQDQFSSSAHSLPVPDSTYLSYAVPNSDFEIFPLSIRPIRKRVIEFQFAYEEEGYLASANCELGMLNDEVPSSLESAELLHAACSLAFGRFYR